jgi:hypothetical protein
VLNWVRRWPAWWQESRSVDVTGQSIVVDDGMWFS